MCKHTNETYVQNEKGPCSVMSWWKIASKHIVDQSQTSLAPFKRKILVLNQRFSYNVISF